MDLGNEKPDLRLFGLQPEQGRWLLIPLGIIVLLCLGTVQSWIIFRELLEELFKIESTQTLLQTKSLLPYTGVLLFFAVMMPIAGFYIERIGVRKIIALAGIIIGFGYILSCFATTILALTLTYGIILGTGVGIAYGVPILIAIRWFPERKWLAVGLTVIGFRLSPLLTAPFADDLFNEYGVKKTLLTSGILFTIIILGISSTLTLPPKDWEPKTKQVSKASQISGLANRPDMLKSRSFYGLWICCMLATLVGISAIRISSPVAQEIIQLNQVVTANTVSLFTLFSCLGCPFFAWVTDRLQPKYAAITSYILILIASIGMTDANHGDVATYLIAFFLFWFCLAGWLAIVPIATLSLYNSENYAKNYGILFTAYAVGTIVGTLVAVRVHDLFETYTNFFYSTAFLATIGIVVATSTLKREQIIEQSVSKTNPSLWDEIRADAIANGGIFSYKRLVRLFLIHSGFQLLVAFRVQQRIRRFGGMGSFVADLLLKFATDLTGCHIYPTAILEGGIHFPHAVGIVIGAGAVVHSGVTIYQNVTLGRSNKDSFAYPELCQDCTIFCGAVLLGNIRIGKNAIVGANAVVLQSVPDDSIAVGIPARIIKK